MTMRTCGRVVPFGVVDMVAGTIMFMGCAPLECRSEIARDAQPFERVFGFMVERSPRALRYFGLLELDQDLLDRGRVRGDGEGDVGIAERAVALAVVGKIERNDRDVLAFGVGPDIGLGPMQDWVNAQMRAWRRRGVELVPELRRLVAHVPSALGAAGRG